MPVYVPNYKHDIFISYAPIDNQPLSSADKGWVTTLVNGLKIFIGKKLGHPDAFSLWMDDQLQGDMAVTPYLYEQLEGAATLLVILSPAYLACQSCHAQLHNFLAKGGKTSGRIFLIEHDVVQRPDELSDLLGYKFWRLDDFNRPRTLAIPKPNPDEVEYYQKLDDLSRQLVDKLKNLKEQSKSQSPIHANIPASAKATAAMPKADAPNSSITVFLAEVTDDLEERRQEVKRYLEQQGVCILPNKLYSFANIQQAMDQDLKASQLFVQLLSDKVGNNYPRFQYERAQAAQIPILQWRDPQLNLAAINDASHNDLLEMSTVIATGLVEFQTYVINQLKKKDEHSVKSLEGDMLVFINAAPEDMTVAHQIKEFLDHHGFGYSLPLDIAVTTKAAEIRYHLEQNLLACDSVIVIYGNTSIIWVNEQLLYCRRLQSRRDQPLKVIAVYNTPSVGKPPLNIKLPNMQILDCPAPHVTTCLPRFLQCLPPT